MTTTVTNNLALARTRLAQAQGYELPQNQEGRGNVIVKGNGNTIFINPSQNQERPFAETPFEGDLYGNQQIDPKQLMAVFFQTIMGLLGAFGQLLGLNQNGEGIENSNEEGVNNPITGISDISRPSSGNEFNDLIPWLNKLA